MTYTHKITNNTLEIWNNARKENKAPLIIQPQWPNGDPWESEQQIKDWADAKIEELSNNKSEFIAGSGPNQPLDPRAETDKKDFDTKEEGARAKELEVIIQKLADLGLTIKEIKIATQD
jgi:hypothetical protein